MVVLGMLKTAEFRSASKVGRGSGLCVLALTAALTSLQAQEVIGSAGPLRLGALYAGSVNIEPKATAFRFAERVTFGSQWPLLADKAYIGCARLLPRVTVMIVVDGVPWALNSESKSWLRDNVAELEVGGQKVAVNAAAQHEP